MDISEEASRILLNLPNVEALASIFAIGENTCGEGATDASNGGSQARADLDWIGKGDAIKG